MLRIANGLSWILVTACLCTTTLAACSRSAPDTPAAALPTTLSFAAVERAENYRVRAWNDYRLLFEISVRDTQFALTPALRRALKPFDDVELEVTAYDGGGALIRTERRAPRSLAGNG